MREQERGEKAEKREKQRSSRETENIVEERQEAKERDRDSREERGTRGGRVEGRRDEGGRSNIARVSEGEWRGRGRKTKREERDANLEDRQKEIEGGTLRVRRPVRSEEERSDRGDREINVENVNTRVGQVYEGFKLGTAFQDPAVRPSVRSFIPFLESGSAPVRERYE